MKPFRVLIIDDSLTIRAILEHIFAEDRECEVVGVASSVEEARKLMATTEPNIITLDLALPEVDGMQFLDELRAQSAHAPIVVISSSTKGRNAVAREAIERGAMACFDKARVITDARRLVRVMKRAAVRSARIRAKGRGPDAVAAAAWSAAYARLLAQKAAQSVAQTAA